MRMSDWSSDVCSSDLCKSQTPRPGPGRKGASARRSALFAHPHLLPADEGDAAGHAELLAAFEQFDLRLVGLALGRIEHGAAVPLVAVLLQAPEDGHALHGLVLVGALALVAGRVGAAVGLQRSEEHTSELQSLMRISNAVFCWKKKTKH